MSTRWTAFPLHPDTPEDGRTLEDLFSGRPVHVPDMVNHLRQTARTLNLPFGDRTQTFNSRLAQELGKWAESEEKGDAYHGAVFLAYFRDGRNIAKPHVLREIVESVGLSGDVAEEIIASRRFREAVDRDWSRSRALGVTAVPSFRWKGEWLVGAQPYDRLLEWISGISP